MQLLWQPEVIYLIRLDLESETFRCALTVLLRKQAVSFKCPALAFFAYM
jgi:hypothetical protein